LFFDDLRRRKIVSFCALDQEEALACQTAGLAFPDDVHALLSELRPEDGEALFLHEVEGYTASEISRVTGQPRGTVLSLVYRARERLLKLPKMKQNEFGMNNQQELRRALKSFYCARSLPRTRVDFLLQARTRMAQSARPWLTIPLVQIAALAATIVIFLLVADHEEYQQAVERGDPEITEILKQHGRAGVPMYLVYPAGVKDQQPVVLPELITSQTVIEAFTERG
jgi:Sigma-70, region 4